MKKKQLYEDMQNRMTLLVGELRGREYSELLELPQYADQEQQFGKWTYSLATWRDTLEDGTVQVMVQAYHRLLLGIGTMLADGFRMTKSGAIVDVPQDVMYEFM